MAINYKEVLKGRGYRKLFATTIINRFGDSIDAIAFTWLVYQVTHSGAWSAIIFALNILPNVIVQPFAGAAVERLDKKKVMVVTHILRGPSYLSPSWQCIFQGLLTAGSWQASHLSSHRLKLSTCRRAPHLSQG